MDRNHDFLFFLITAIGRVMILVHVLGDRNELRRDDGADSIEPLVLRRCFQHKHDRILLSNVTS